MGEIGRDPTIGPIEFFIGTKMKIKAIKPKVGGRYRSLEKEFVITGLPEMYEAKWVEYTDKDNKRDFYCRLDAFLERFGAIAE